MQAIDTRTGHRPFPPVEGESFPAFPLCSSIQHVTIGTKQLDFTGRDQSGSSLQLGLLARTERGGDSLNKTDQSDSKNNDRAQDFHQRKPRVLPVAAHWRSSSTIRTRAVTGLIRSASRNPSRSRNRT